MKSERHSVQNFHGYSNWVFQKLFYLVRITVHGTCDGEKLWRAFVTNGYNSCFDQTKFDDLVAWKICICLAHSWGSDAWLVLWNTALFGQRTAAELNNGCCAFERRHNVCCWCSRGISFSCLSFAVGSKQHLFSYILTQLCALLCHFRQSPERLSYLRVIN